MQHLSSEEIDRLFDFVQAKSVRYIDVQHEIVDHLASDMESEMHLNPALTFDQALHLAYGKFPVTGFYHFVEQKEKALKRYWRTRQIHYLRTYFTLPKILMTLAVLLTVFTVFHYGPAWLTVTTYVGAGVAAFWSVGTYSRPEASRSDYYLGGFFLIGMGTVVMVLGQDDLHFLVLGAASAIVGLIIVLSKWLNKHTYSRQQQYLVLQTFYQSLWVGAAQLLVLPLYADPSRLIDMMPTSITVSLIASVLVTIAIVYSHAMQAHFRHMLDEELRVKYPHLEMV